METARIPDPPTSTPARVFLVVDSSLLRAGLERLLGRGGVVVVGRTSDPREALEVVRRGQVDVLLVDLRKPDGEGFEWGLRLHRELDGVPVLLVRENPGPDQVRVAMDSGVECILAPDEDPAELFSAIHSLSRGRSYLSPRLAPHVSARWMKLSGGDLDPQVSRLSAREIEVVRQLALGRTVHEVSVACGLAESKAEECIRALSDMLDCRSNADFARFAIREGLLPRAD